MHRVKPTGAQLREALAAGRAYGLNREGAWNPYFDSNRVLSRAWKSAYRAGRDERRKAAGLPPTPTAAETAERFARLGIEMI